MHRMTDRIDNKIANLCDKLFHLSFLRLPFSLFGFKTKSVWQIINLGVKLSFFPKYFTHKKQFPIFIFNTNSFFVKNPFELSVFAKNTNCLIVNGNIKTERSGNFNQTV